MKVILLHLSDIHIKSSGDNPVLFHAQHIAAATASIAADAEQCFVAVTGDIAFSGAEDEYRLADRFFTSLRDELSDRLPECECHLVVVPGNHDCDFSEADELRALVLDALSPKHFYESIYSKCVSVQENYESFASNWVDEDIQNDVLLRLYSQKTYSLSTGAIRFRLINSAWMSTKEETQGRLLFPVELIQSREQLGGVDDIVVTLLHHPYNWFEATNARVLWRELEISDIILTGHEHDGSWYIKTEPDGSIGYLEGAILQDTSDPLHSGFNVLVLDFVEKKQELYVFSWDTQGYYKPPASPFCTDLSRNLRRLRSEYVVNEHFQEILSDPGAKFSHPYKEQVLLGDIFVYPDLRWLNPPGEDPRSTRVVSEQIPAFVYDQRHVLILGSEKCGKTALAKMLFQDLRARGVIPVYVTGPDMGYAGQSAQQAVDRAFGKEYISPDKDRFRQEERKKRAIIIDDFDHCRANAHGRDRILRALEKTFDVIILLGDEQLRFDDLVAQEEGVRPIIWRFTHCAILPFSALRRADLVKRWCTLGRWYTCDEYELSRHARLAERTIDMLLGQGFIPAHPIFILAMLQQLEASTPLNVAPVSGSYGYIYEVLLTMALVQASDTSDELDTQYTYLSEFAYFLFKEQTLSVGVSEALAWHNKHCAKYRLSLDFDEYLSTFCKALILCKENDTVYFRYPYAYYYFVSRYLSEHINEPMIREHIATMSKQLNHKHSANILMFLSYKSRDPFILDSILGASRNLFSSYHEYELAENAEFLEKLTDGVPQLVIDSSDPETRRRRLLAEKDEFEEIWSDEEQEEDRESIDLDEDLDELLQINVAFKTIQIAGQILRNYHGSLEGERKLALARACYSLGLRVLAFMFGIAESELGPLIDLFVDMFQSAEPEKSTEEIAKYARRFIFHLLEGLALGMIKQVSDSVGLDKLSGTFNDLLQGNESVSYRLIDLSIRLDYYPGFPKKQVLDLDKDTRHSSFAARLLRDLVWLHLYIHQVGRDIRESVCARLHIKLLPSAALDERVKQLKG